MRRVERFAERVRLVIRVEVVQVRAIKVRAHFERAIVVGDVCILVQVVAVVCMVPFPMVRMWM